MRARYGRRFAPELGSAISFRSASADFSQEGPTVRMPFAPPGSQERTLWIKETRLRLSRGTALGLGKAVEAETGTCCPPDSRPSRTMTELYRSRSGKVLNADASLNRLTNWIVANLST